MTFPASRAKQPPKAPWLNRIEQPPPKGQVAGSNPAGVTTSLQASGLCARTGRMTREDIDPYILALSDKVTTKRARTLIDYLIEHGECSTENLNDLGYDTRPGLPVTSRKRAASSP